MIFPVVISISQLLFGSHLKSITEDDFTLQQFTKVIVGTLCNFKTSNSLVQLSNYQFKLLKEIFKEDSPMLPVLSIVHATKKMLLYSSHQNALQSNEPKGPMMFAQLFVPELLR